VSGIKDGEVAIGIIFLKGREEVRVRFRVRVTMGGYTAMMTLNESMNE